MADFSASEERLAVTHRRFPAFPHRSAGLVRLIKHIHKLLSDDANAALKPHGISYPEYIVLMMIYGTASGTMSPSELSEAAGEKLANITRLTDQLSQKGLIRRGGSDDDRRRVEVSLAPAGLAMLEGLLPEISRLVERQVQPLSAAERSQLDKLLKKMLGGLDSE